VWPATATSKKLIEAVSAKPGTCRSTLTFIPTGVLGSVRSIVQK
jgi:hypothetical protein